MEVEKQTMTFDELSVERSKSFVTALQELKNLRPQLYSAAEYCEKPYLNSEQKQMFLDNLKDYVVRALVNAIDHLGTVAYKLSDVLEQQTLEVSSIDLKVTCLNQKLLTCQTYTEKEGLRQQQLLAIIPRHHKHYTLPNSFNKKVHFSPPIQMDPKKAIQARGRLYPSGEWFIEWLLIRLSCNFMLFNAFGFGASTAKTLSWHMASETKSTLKGSSRGIMSAEDSRMDRKTSGVLNSLDAYENKRLKSAPATRVAMGVTRREPLEGSKPEKEIVRPRVRSKNIISSFFAKQKATSLRTSA